MKKILFVSHEAGVNGSTTSLVSLIKGIKQIRNDDVEITVLIPWMPMKFRHAKNTLEKNGIKCKEMLYRINYKPVNIGKNLKEYMYDILNCIAVVLMSFYVKRNRIDVVCSNSVSVDVGARAARLTRVKHVYYVREFMEEDHGLEFRNKRRMKKLLESSDYIVFISKVIAEKYSSIYKLKKTKQFYNDIDIKRYFIANRDILLNEKISVIQVGIYSEGKGTLNSIQMMHMLIKAGIDMFHLEFVGDGDERLKKQMKEMITKFELSDYISVSSYAEDIKTKLVGADILLMNSRWEGFGRVTVEGMLAGCLVLGRNSAGTAEIVQDGLTGLLFNNEQDFMRLSKYIIQNRGRVKMIAKNGQNWAVNEFSFGKCSQLFCDFVFE